MCTVRVSDLKHLTFWVPGPNELSFRTPAAVAPLMGPAGLAKGPCKLARTVSRDPGN